ncbi:hypothetical protein TNCV_3349851 [Trichonephila clavipes]|nr:hypothetical protein TNCV_3349851 [Trichonephila clavipes]
MTEMGNSFPAASSLCNISTTVLLNRGELVSQQPMTRCFQWVTDPEIMQARETIEYPVYLGVSVYLSEHDVHMILHYLVGRERLVGVENRA